MVGTGSDFFFVRGGTGWEVGTARAGSAFFADATFLATGALATAFGDGLPTGSAAGLAAILLPDLGDTTVFFIGADAAALTVEAGLAAAIALAFTAFDLTAGAFTGCLLAVFLSVWDGQRMLPTCR